MGNGKRSRRKRLAKLKLINKCISASTIHAPNSSDTPIKATLTPLFLRVVLAFTIVISSLLYLTLNYQYDTNRFVSTLNTDEVVFNAPTNTALKSPLCGCADSAINRYGIMVPGNDITIKRKSTSNSTNYLITAATESVTTPCEGYSMDIEYFRYSDTIDFDPFLIPHKLPKKFISNRLFKNIPFISIITNSQLKIKMSGKNQILSYLPSFNSPVNVKVNSNRYRHETKNFEIKESFKMGSEANECPRVDLLGDSIIITWRGSAKLLGIYGEYFIKEKFNPSQKYLNILIVKSPFATRLSALGWSENSEKEWKELLMAQFKHKGLFINQFPLLLIKENGDCFFPPLDSIKPAKAPNMLLADTGTFDVVVNKLMSKSSYDSLRGHYLDTEQYIHQFKNGNFRLASIQEYYDVPDTIEQKLNRLHAKLENVDKIDEQVLIVRQVQALLERYGKSKIIPEKRVYMKNGTAVFRYPSLPPEYSISIFGSFDYLKMINSRGHINIDDEFKTINVSSTVEFSNLDSGKFEYPAIRIGLNNDPDFKIQGIAKININDKSQGKRLIELPIYGVVTSVLAVLGLFFVFYPPRYIAKNEKTA